MLTTFTSNYDETNKRWVNHTVVRIGGENTTTYKLTIDESVFKGKVRIYVESEKHIRIEWHGRTYPTTEYLGIWVMDNQRNQNATVFEAEKREETRIMIIEMRPICNETEESPAPEFTRPATYIEIEGRYFKLKNYVALQFAGHWNNLSISVGDYSWFSCGNATAHAFVIPVSDWNTFDDARIDVNVDNISLVGYVRVVYWWEDVRSLFLTIFYTSLLVLFIIVVYKAIKQCKK